MRTRKNFSEAIRWAKIASPSGKIDSRFYPRRDLWLRRSALPPEVVAVLDNCHPVETEICGNLSQKSHAVQEFGFPDIQIVAALRRQLSWTNYSCHKLWHEFGVTVCGHGFSDIQFVG